MQFNGSCITFSLFANTSLKWKGYLTCFCAWFVVKQRISVAVCKFVTVVTNGGFVTVNWYWCYCTCSSKSQVSWIKILLMTRIHSGRMRTVRSSIHVYPSMHWKGGCIPACTGQGVYLSMHWGEGCVSQHALGGGGVSAGRCLPRRGCVCPGEVCLPGGCIPACTEADTPLPTVDSIIETRL